MNLKNIFGSLAVAATVALGAAEIAAAAPGYIAGYDYGSRVTLRSGPSVESGAMGYGLVGQDVEVLDWFFNEYEGAYWAEVYFYESDTVGYIHGSYIEEYVEY